MSTSTLPERTTRAVADIAKELEAIGARVAALHASIPPRGTLRQLADDVDRAACLAMECAGITPGKRG